MNTIGRILFYILWPAVWFYAPLTTRVRVIVQHEDNVLVVKNWFGPGQWQLPGGGMKRGESPIDTAMREVKEELGLTDIARKQCMQITDEATVGTHAGLLLRHHIVELRYENIPEITTNWEVTAYDWKKIDELGAAYPGKIDK